MVFHQVVGALACFVVVILILGFAIQFWRERGSTSEKVNLGCILLKNSIFQQNFKWCSHVSHERLGLSEGGGEFG